MSETRLIGIAGWRLIPNEPRHNTFHNSLHAQALQDHLPLQYFGLKNTHPTNWINQVLPDTILKKYPFLSVTNFYKFRLAADLSMNKKSVMYIFEGSISWLFMMSLYAYLNPKLTVVCNLFSSSKYDRIFYNRYNHLRFKYKIFFTLLTKLKQSIVTFDTSTMANKTKNLVSASNIETFPVTSSFPYKPIPRSKKEHFDVLVNLRSFGLDDLHRMLKSSCKQCTFTFPRGPMAQTSLEIEFSIYPNARFDIHNIPMDRYMDYFDSFDYIILMYKPTIDASGKLLDAIARRLPVCIPSESLEWVSIAELWGEHYAYKWKDDASMNKSFDHPAFTQPNRNGEPSFTPTETLKSIQEFHVSRPQLGGFTRAIRSVLVFSCILLYSNIARVFNIWAGIIYITESNLKKLRGK